MVIFAQDAVKLISPHFFGLTGFLNTIALYIAREGQRGHGPPKFLENVVILCFERFSKQNSVIRLKSNILPPQNFWAGYATGLVLNTILCAQRTVL